MITHSKHYAASIAESTFKIGDMVNSESEARDWGRIAARLRDKFSRNDVYTEVMPEFQAIALAAYEKRMIQLYGAPF